MQYLYPNIPLKCNEEPFFSPPSVSAVWPTLNGILSQRSKLLVFVGMFPTCFLWRIGGVNTVGVRRAGGARQPSPLTDGKAEVPVPGPGVLRGAQGARSRS